MTDTARPIDGFTDRICQWTDDHDDYSNLWATECGNTWEFINDGPIENKTKCCPYCGGRIVVEVKA
jgi:DNA-directed RNA polymerase subunit RPC12/RpoP